MNPVSSSLILVLGIYMGLRLAAPAVRSLLNRLLRRTIGKIDAASAGRPATLRALRQQVDNTPGPLLKLLVARALLKSYREPRNERLAGLFLALGAVVIGGPMGQDYKRAWADDLNQAGADGKIPAVLLANALSCFLSSPQIRWEEKTSPRLRNRFERQYKIGGLLLAAAARSRPSAFFLIALPATPPLALTGYMTGYIFGSEALGWALAALAITEVPRRTDRWQRERQLAADTRRAAGN